MQEPQFLRREDVYGPPPHPLIITDQLMKGKMKIDVVVIDDDEPEEVQAEPVDAAAAAMIAEFDEQIKELEEEIQAKEKKIAVLKAKKKKFQQTARPTDPAVEPPASSSQNPAADPTDDPPAEPSEPPSGDQDPQDEGVLGWTGPLSSLPCNFVYCLLFPSFEYLDLG